ncbi:hypothetical protein CP03DC29_0786 [Chlamydia psittaci 03DC29]|nr:hypothetical protein CP03DC29_0786 [Chlamydia psittaci 03DC29]
MDVIAKVSKAAPRAHPVGTIQTLKLTAKKPVAEAIDNAKHPAPMIAAASSKITLHRGTIKALWFIINIRSAHLERISITLDRAGIGFPSTLAAIKHV